MKPALLIAFLLLGGRAIAQPSYQGPETTTPVKWQKAVVLQTSDSAATAYSTTLRALVGAGYGIERSDKQAGYIGTTPKSLDGHTFLSLRALVQPTSTGSDVTLNGVYSQLNSTTIMAGAQNRQLPVQYIGRGNSGTQQAWQAMMDFATSTFPQAKMGYK